MAKIILITRERLGEDGSSSGDCSIGSSSSSSSSSSAIEALKGRGFSIMMHRTIEAVRDEERVMGALNRLLSSEYDYVVFMSISAVRFIADAMVANGLEPRMLNRCTVVAVGPSTRDELLKHGVRVDLIPSKYSSYGLIELFRSIGSDGRRGRRVFIPRSSEASDLLANALTSLGFAVEEEHIYRIVPSRHDGWKSVADAIANRSLHYIIFTSSSSVRAFFTVIGEVCDGASLIDAIANSTRIIAIGPVTAETIRGYGLNPYVADEHTVEGTLKLLLNIIQDDEDNP